MGHSSDEDIDNKSNPTDPHDREFTPAEEAWLSDIEDQMSESPSIGEMFPDINSMTDEDVIYLFMGAFIGFPKEVDYAAG